MGRGRASQALDRRRPQSHRAEIADLERFAQLATSIDHNAKGKALLKALARRLRQGRELGARREGDHLHRVAANPELPAAPAGRQSHTQDGIVLFNGSNTDDVSKQIYADGSSATRHRSRHRLDDRGHALGAGRLLP